MKKLFYGGIVALALGVLLFSFYSGRLLASAIEEGGEIALGVDTEVGGAVYSPIKGEFRTRDIVIANPEGYSDNQFLILGQGRLVTNFGAYFKDVVRIRRLEFENLFLSIEQGLDGSNYGTILDHLERTLAEEDRGGASSGSSKQFTIDALVCTNVAVHMELTTSAGPLSSLDVTIPEVRLTRVGTAEGGVSLGRVADQLVRELLRSSIELSGTKAPKEVLEGLERELGIQLENLKREAEAVIENTLGEIEEQLDGVLEGVLGDR